MEQDKATRSSKQMESQKNVPCYGANLRLHWSSHVVTCVRESNWFWLNNASISMWRMLFSSQKCNHPVFGKCVFSINMETVRECHLYSGPDWRCLNPHSNKAGKVSQATGYYNFMRFNIFIFDETAPGFIRIGAVAREGLSPSKAKCTRNVSTWVCNFLKCWAVFNSESVFNHEKHVTTVMMKSQYEVHSQHLL